MSKVNSTLLLSLAIVVFGLNYPVLKYILGIITPHTANAIRLSLGFLILFVLYTWWTPNPFNRFLGRISGNWRSIVIVGLIGYYLSPVCYLMGMARSYASNASIIIASAPVWTVLFSWLLGLDRLSDISWIAMGLGFSGSLLVGILPRTELPTVEMLVGNGLLLLDAALWGIFIVLNRQLMDELRPLEATVWSLMIALPLLWGTVVLISPLPIPHLMNSSLLVALAFSGFLSMGIGQFWWNIGLNDLGPARAGIFANAIPLVALASSVIFLKELLTTIKIAGVTLILAGVFLLQRDTELKQTPTPGKAVIG